MVKIQSFFSQLSILAIKNYCIMQPNLNPSNDKSMAQKEDNIVLQWCTLHH